MAIPGLVHLGGKQFLAFMVHADANALRITNCNQKMGCTSIIMQVSGYTWKLNRFIFRYIPIPNLNGNHPIACSPNPSKRQSHLGVQSWELGGGRWIWCTCMCVFCWVLWQCSNTSRLVGFQRPRIRMLTVIQNFSLKRGRWGALAGPLHSPCNSWTILFT